MKKYISVMLGLVLAFAPVSAFGAEAALVDKEIQILDSDAMTMDFIENAKYYEDKNGNFVFEKVEKLATAGTKALAAMGGDIKVDNYAKETLVIVPTNNEERVRIQKAIKEIQNPIITRSSGSGSQEFDEWDKTGSILAYLKVEYSLSTVDGIQYAKLTKVSGNHSRTSSGVSVKSQFVRYASQGFYNGGYQTKSDTYKPTSSSWSKTPSSTWKAVDTSASCLIGANYELTVGRGSSSWSFTIENNPFDN